MCGNDDIIISSGGGCGSSGETIRISRNYGGCGSNDGYIVTRDTGIGCGATTTSYYVDEDFGRSIIDEINYRRENQDRRM